MGEKIWVRHYLTGKAAQPDYPHQIILAKVDGKLHELKDMEIENEKVEYITTAAAVGNETYRRSVVLLMLHAIYQTAPGTFN